MTEADGLDWSRADERASKFTPENVRLEGGKPLYYAFLKEPDALALSHEESEAAHETLRKLAQFDENGVISCQGKTLDEAKKILEGIRTSMDSKASE